MDYIQAIGLIAAALTTFGLVPQVLKAYFTKSTKDISKKMFTMLCIGIFLWLVYGVLINDLPLIAANAVSLVLAASILFMKIKYK